MAIEIRRERLPDATDQLAQPRALLRKLIKAVRQLTGHAVELGPERGELVATFDRDRRGEVPAAEPSGGFQEAAELSLQLPRGLDREEERKEQKPGDEYRGDHAAAADRGSSCRQVRQDRHLDRRAAEPGKLLGNRPVLHAAD